MSLSLGLAVLMSAQAAAPGEAWVVLTRRSGITTAQAMELTRAVSARLSEDGVPNSLAVEDLSSCSGRKPCLVELGRKKQVQAMVLVELGTVLDDAFARAEAVSVEADGTRLGLAEVEASSSRLSEALVAQVRVVLTPALKSALGVEPAPVVATPAPTPEPEAAPIPPPLPPVEQPIALTPVPFPQPAPVEVVSAPVQRAPYFTGSHVVGVVLLGLGVGGLVGAAVLGGEALTQVGTQTRLCPRGQICEDPAAFTAYQSAVASQSTGLVLAGVGGGLAITGAVLMAIPHREKPTVSFTPLPGGAAAVVSGSF